jgi:hypothetical protein
MSIAPDAGVVLVAVAGDEVAACAKCARSPVGVRSCARGGLERGAAAGRGAASSGTYRAGAGVVVTGYGIEREAPPAAGIVHA